MKHRLNNLINADVERINYSTSFFKFLESNHNSNVIAKLLYNFHSDCYNDFPAYRFMFTTSEINYLTFRNDGTISYLPNGKEHKVNEDNSWSKDGRQNGKPAKVIRKLFTERAQSLLKDSDFETFTNRYKAAFSNDGYTLSVSGVYYGKLKGSIEPMYAIGSRKGVMINQKLTRRVTPKPRLRAFDVALMAVEQLTQDEMKQLVIHMLNIK